MHKDFKVEFNSNANDRVMQMFIKIIGLSPICHNLHFISLIKGKPLMPPMITNKEKEIDGCNVSVMWTLSTCSACSVTYTIRYREIKMFMSDCDPGWIIIHNVTSFFHTIPLGCNKEYEIAVTAGSTNGWSTSWRVKTKSGMAVHYF